MTQSISQSLTPSRAIGWWNWIPRAHFWQLSIPFSPWKKYKWLRLPFGLKVSSDIFQDRLNSVLQGVKGITGCVDNVLARSADSKEHDVNVLRATWESNDEWHKVQSKETAVQEHQMWILWTHADAGRNEDWWQNSGGHKADECTKRQEKSSEFPTHD